MWNSAYQYLLLNRSWAGMMIILLLRYTTYNTMNTIHIVLPGHYGQEHYFSDTILFLQYL